MNRILLFVAMISSSAVFAQMGSLSNGNFENWDRDTTLTLNDWFVSDFENGTAARVGNAQNQNFAIQLKNVIDGTDSLSGILFYGDPQSFAGAPYVAPVDSMIFWAKYNFPTNANGEVIVVQFSQGQFIPTVVQVSGTAANWTRMGVELSSPVQDSILILFSSSGLFLGGGYNANSTFTIDNVSLKGLVPGPALPNQSFENYTETIIDYLDDYLTSNDAIGFFGTTETPVDRVTDIQNGTYAARLQGIDVNGNYLPGVIANNFNENFDQTNGVHYTASPDSVIGYYKGNIAAGDTAFIGFYFTDNAGNEVASAEIPVFGNIANYTAFRVPLTYSGTPDSMALIIYSGENPNSVLFVDNFMFKGGNVGLNEQSPLTVSLYPNPTTSNLYVMSAKKLEEIQISNLSGQIVLTIRPTGILNNISVADLPAGTYLVKFSTEGQETIKTFVKQ